MVSSAAVERNAIIGDDGGQSCHMAVHPLCIDFNILCCSSSALALAKQLVYYLTVVCITILSTLCQLDV